MKRLAFIVCIGGLFAGAQAMAHGHHHGKPLTEAERKASEGDFADKDVKDRPLSDWQGIWQSLYPYLQNGDLDPVLMKKAKLSGKSVEDYRDYYKKGYASDVEMIGIENGVMEFHTGKAVNACRYAYTGFKILTYSSGKKGVRYLYECTEPQSKRRNMSSSATILSPRVLRSTSIFSWAIARRKPCSKRWITGRRTIPTI